MTKQMRKPQIGIGCQVGMLTVAAATSRRKNGYTVWRCSCSCGGEILLDTRTLQRGTVRDCGCETRVKPGQRDITGQRFGKLTAISPTGRRGRDRSMVWHCKCDCGGEVDVSLHQLSVGYRKSCGCLSHPPVKDLTGRRFGLLLVQEYAGKLDGVHCWRCLCDCGRETVVRCSDLLDGHTKSCGCLQRTQIIDNLRLVDGTSVTMLEAARKRVIASNTSGYNGVYQEKKNGRWRAQITFKGKTYYLGSYERIEDAVEARRRGEEMHEDFLTWYHNVYEKQAQGKDQEKKADSLSKVEKV